MNAVKHPVTAAIVVGSYAILCALVIAALRLAAGKAPADLPVQGNPLTPLQLLAFLVAAVLVVGLIIRKVKARTAWELILGAALFLGVWFYCWIVFSGEVGLIAASLITLLQAWIRRVWIHNVFILLGTAGVAINFAFLFPTHTLLVLLVGLAAYDTFAGRPGGVAARFAASLVHRGVIPGLIVPGRIRELFTPILQVIKKPDAVFLGAGDLVLPLMLVARSAMDLTGAFAVSAGTLLTSAWLGLRGPTRPFPALLPLAAGAGIPFLALMLLHRL